MKQKSVNKLTRCLSLFLILFFSSYSYSCKCESKQTPLQKMYEVKGPVKSIIIRTYNADKKGNSHIPVNEGYVTLDLKFDKNGMLIQNGNLCFEYSEDGSFLKGKSLDDTLLNPVLTFNELGQLTQESVKPEDGLYSEIMYLTKYSFDNNGALLSQQTVFLEGATKYNYTVDEKGLRSHSRYIYSDYDLEQDHSISYTYSKFDDLGNWTERIGEDNITIIEEDNIYFRKEYIIETREVTYY